MTYYGRNTPAGNPPDRTEDGSQCSMCGHVEDVFFDGETGLSEVTNEEVVAFRSEHFDPIWLCEGCIEKASAYQGGPQ
jgi:hypothetical protein